MRRVYKKSSSKRGFSLTEVIIVVGIIVIIAAVVGVGIFDILNTARDSDDAVKASSEQLKQQINDGEASLAKYNF